MTARVCLVGNSHLGALKRGWDLIEHEYPTVLVDMFGAPGRAFGGIVVEEGKVQTTERKAAASFLATGGREEIILADYDLIVVVGGSMWLYQMANLLKSHCPPFMNIWLDPVGDSVLNADQSAQLKRFYRKKSPISVSDALLRELMRAKTRQSQAIKITDGIAANCRVPVLHVPAPFPSSEIVDTMPKNIIAKLVKMGMSSVFVDLIWDALDHVLRDKAEIVQPPDHVIVSGLFTEKSYAEGGLRLDENRGEHDDENIGHMNGQYGIEIMRLVLDRIPRGKV